MPLLPPQHGQGFGRREGLLISQDSEAQLRVVHVITGLGLGGAEMTLYALLRSLGDDAAHHTVVSLGPVGPLTAPMIDLGCTVVSLDMHGALGVPAAVSAVRRVVRETGADIVHSWMYHANLVAGLAMRGPSQPPLVWAVHNTNLDVGSISRSTLRVVRFCGRFSGKWPRAILYASEASRVAHEGIGYAPERSIVIPNGFALDQAPDSGARARMRESQGIAEDTPVIGMVARWDAQKDLPNMIEAVVRLHKARPEAVVILCGEGLEWINGDLRRPIEASGAAEAYRLLGARSDVPEVMSAFDIHTLSSKGESFPRVVAESMLLGIPNVVTDVGDCADIVGDSGRVVPPSDPVALAAGWLDMLSLDEGERGRLGQSARQRIAASYGVDLMRQRYFQLYSDVLRDALGEVTS